MPDNQQRSDGRQAKNRLSIFNLRLSLRHGTGRRLQASYPPNCVALPSRYSDSQHTPFKDRWIGRASRS